jgi:hypothetical protein
VPWVGTGAEGDKEPKEHLGIPSSVFRLSICRGSQRDVVYLGWPIAKKRGGGGTCRVSANDKKKIK